jgi:glutathione S-transferase
MRFYTFWSPNPQKVHLALKELGISHERMEVDLFKGEQRHPEFRALNPHQKVPVIDDDGFVLWESNAILAYLGEREARLWPNSARGRGDALRWLSFEARHLSDPIGVYWFNDSVAPKAGRPRDEVEIARAGKLLPTALGVLDEHLTKRQWVLGPDFSLVDCGIAPILAALSASTFDLAPYAATRAYLERARQRPAWKECAFRY